MLKTKRIYETPDPKDGNRYLVDALWPRGVSKEDAELSGWLKELAPSGRLRKWFDHSPEHWGKFRQRYRAELGAAKKKEILDNLADQAASGNVTLLYAARRTVYPPGTKILGKVYKPVKTEDGRIKEGELAAYTYMVKDPDSEKTKATGGWHFVKFDTQRNRVDIAPEQACFGCHKPHKKSDYVKSKPLS